MFRKRAEPINAKAEIVYSAYDRIFIRKRNNINLDRKNMKRRAAHSFMRLGDINERQAEIIRLFYDNPKDMITVKDMEARFSISPTTAKSDIVGLIERGILTERQLNKVKRGYVRSDNFEEKTQ